MAQPLIEATELTKIFPVRSARVGGNRGSMAAVAGVTFSIAPGETLALVGESGCGKTTIAKLVLRLHEPTSGRVVVQGKDVHRLTGPELRWFRRSVQAVFQDPWASLSPRRRVGHIVGEPLVVNRGLSRAEIRRQVAAMLEQVGLEPWHAKLFPHEFSGGQRQRIALASALITDPKLIVLDEPLSALDVSVQAQIINLLKDIQQAKGTSFLLITHDLETVRYLAHRIAVMYLGKLVEEASTDELFACPRHPYTQALFASILPRHPDERRPDLRVFGELPSPMNPPSGCRFRTRCPHAMDVCSSTPATALVGPDHVAVCHLFDRQSNDEPLPVPSARSVIINQKE